MKSAYTHSQVPGKHKHFTSRLVATVFPTGVIGGDKDPRFLTKG